MAYYEDFIKFGCNKAAIQEDGTSVTYEELYGQSQSIGKVIGKRCLVFSFCRNTIGSMSGYLSFLANRIVPLLLDAEIDEELAQNLMSIYRPEYIYVPETIVGRFSDMEKVYEKYDYTLLKTGFESAHLNEDLALLLTTSGSTGSPKLVRQSYANIQANAVSISQYLELNHTERPVTTLPMNYTYGLSIVNSHVLVGATMLLTTKPIVSKEFWDFMKDQKATSFGGVPYTYEMLKRIRFFKMDLPSLRYFTQAGGKLSPELHKEFAEYAQANGKHLIVMYGQTEATARMAYLPYYKALEKYGSMGIAIPGGKFILADANGNPITKPDEVGELIYEGKNVTLGYAECREDLAKGDERNGRLETGDMARMDQDGFFYIVGRKKRFLKLFGNRINLDEIERLVKREFEDVDVATGGNDEQMRVFITNETLIDSVASIIMERTHINARAIKVEYIEEIPRNEAGKILYKLLPQ